jgi:hypothetical protein
MINNFTDWASNNEKVVAAGDVFMNRLNSEQKRILAEVYSDFTHFMNAPVALVDGTVVTASSFKIAPEYFHQVLKDLRAQNFAPYLIFNGVEIAGSPASVVIRGAQVTSIQ